MASPPCDAGSGSPARGIVKRFSTGHGAVYLTVALGCLLLLGLYGGFMGGRSNIDTALDSFRKGDYKTALRIARPLAEKGDGRAQFLLGKVYAAGKGVARDAAEADGWFARAVESKAYTPADIAELYLQGAEIPGDMVAGIRWYESCARSGSGECLHRLGVLFQDGKKVPADFAKAFDYLTRAVAMDAASSHESLAEMYRLGQGRPVDPERAVDHLHKAAEAGSATADFRLGDYYSDAERGRQDLATAEHHYLRSARAGNLSGLHRLGLFYLHKKHSPREALKWWKVEVRMGGFNMAYAIGGLYRDGLLPAEDAGVMTLAWYRIGEGLGLKFPAAESAELEARLGPDRVRNAARQAETIRQELGLGKSSRKMR